MAGLKELSSQLKSMQKQIKFGTAQALTSMAKKIQAAEKVALTRKLENPTPFTVNAIGSRAARRDNLVAKVFVKDVAAEYLKPFEVGGDHLLNSQALLNPKNIKLNKYGNLTRNKLSQLKARSDVFIGEVDGVNGVWQRKKPAGRKATRRKRSKKGQHAAKQRKPTLKLLIRFGDALPVKPVLGYMNRAETMAANMLQTELTTAIENAFSTAK